jgi:hypothetical protein
MSFITCFVVARPVVRLFLWLPRSTGVGLIRNLNFLLPATMRRRCREIALEHNEKEDVKHLNAFPLLSALALEMPVFAFGITSRVYLEPFITIKPSIYQYFSKNQPLSQAS